MSLLPAGSVNKESKLAVTGFALERGACGVHAPSAQGERERRAPYGARPDAFSGELSAI